MTQDKEKIIRYIIYVVLGLLILFLIFGDMGLIHYYKLEREREDIERKAGELEVENQLLREEVKKLQEDKEHLERVIRREMGFVKDGELLVIMPPGEDTVEESER